MQSHNAYPDPLASSPAAYNNGAANTPVDSAEPYVHPTIPLGLPHVVQFVEGPVPAGRSFSAEPATGLGEKDAPDHEAAGLPGGAGNAAPGTVRANRVAAVA